MSILLRKINILHTVFQSHTIFNLVLYVVTITIKNEYIIYKQDNPDINNLKHIISNPTILLINGYGILHKKYNEDINVIERIIADTNTFFYKETNGVISFIRRDQLAKITLIFTKSNIDFCDIDFIAKEPTQESIIHYTRVFIKKHITIKNIISAGTSNSLIAESIYKHIRYYVLAAIIIILLANTFIKYNLEKKHSTNVAAIIALQKQNNKLNLVFDEKRQILKIFRDNISWKYSMLCDYLAAQVPSDIILQRIGIQPLSKKIENNELPKVIFNTIIITGYTLYTDKIIDFVENIQKEHYVKQVQLKQMKQNKDEGTFTFNIEIII